MAWVTAFERCPLPQLFEQHREAINVLRQELGDAFEDASLLRYVLSYENHPDQALQAARKALEWRQDHKDLVEAAKQRKPPPGLTMQELCCLQTLLLTSFHGATNFGDPLLIIRVGLSNQTAVLDMMGEEKVELWVNYLNECSFQYCEAATRKMSYFVKHIGLQDFGGMGMMPDRRFFRILGRVSKTNEWLRPQLLGRVVIFNAPSWVGLAFRLASNFLSQKTLSKVWIHRQRPSGTMCPYGQQLIRPESLPSILGGLCTCDGQGCVGGRPNTCWQKPTPEDIPGSLTELLAIRRLPRCEDLVPPAAPPLPSVQPVTTPPSQQPWCRRCCKKRRPLAASADVHV